jgi:hypothetical protein
VRNAFKESMMAPKMQPIIQTNKNKDKYKEQEQEANADMNEEELEKLKLQQQQAAKDREYQPLSFVEFIEFILRISKVIFGDANASSGRRDYGSQIEKGLEVLARAWDTKCKSGSDKSSSHLKMSEKDIIEW